MTVTVDSYSFSHTQHLQSVEHDSNRRSASLKRKRCSLDDVEYTVFEGDVMDESPIKKQRLTSIPTTFFATKDATCSILFVQHNSTSLLNCFELLSNTAALRVGDFCSTCVLSLYQNPLTQEFTVPEFQLVGDSQNSGLVLSYLQGLIARKQEVAIVPLENTNSQLLIFEKHLFQSGHAMDLQNDSINDDTFSLLHPTGTCLHAILVPKFNMVFDLDETLIRSRMPKDAQEQPLAGEHEFFVQGLRLFTAVRPGTDRVLQWACKLFHVLVFTNGVFDYAKEICKILDPFARHLLQGIDLQDDAAIRTILKPRDQMTSVPNMPKSVGLKDLSKFGLDEKTTVCLDDDCNVWVQKENLLPFLNVTQSKLPQEFFNKMRAETWNKIQQLAKSQQAKKSISFSQESVL